jgi:RNA recognition motif-containing protein
MYDIKKYVYGFCEKRFLHAPMHEEMSTQEYKNMRLYVGGLPYQTTEHDLIDLFEQVGQVTEATVITDRDTGRSKGFGFVEMGDEQAARTAIERLNGTLLGDRTITVNEARERQSTGSRGFQGRERRSNNSYRSDRY